MTAAKEVELPPSPKRLKTVAAAAPMNVDLKVTATWKTTISVKPTETVCRVKEIMRLNEGTPIDRIIVSAAGIEQPDTQTLSDLSDLSVEIRRCAHPLRIVLVYGYECDNRTTPSKVKLKMPVVVDGEDKLSTLRSVMLRLRSPDFSYPTSFKFGDRFKLLDEDKSFIDNGFKDCDEIRILEDRRGRGMAPINFSS